MEKRAAKTAKTGLKRNYREQQVSIKKSFETCKHKNKQIV